MSSTLQKFIDSARKRRFFTHFIPFAVFVVGGSFFLKNFASIRYEFRKGKILSDEEAKAMGLDLKQLDVVHKEMLEEMEKDDFDQWENIRGPRPWEDSKTVQDIERQKVEKGT